MAQSAASASGNAAAPGDDNLQTGGTSGYIAALNILKSNAPEDARDLAALQLVASRDSTVFPELVYLLQTDANCQLAIARALTDRPWPAYEFRQPLLALLRNREATVVTAAADALAQYAEDSDVLRQLINIASSQAGDDVRVGVINAIGRFNLKIGAEALVQLQQQDTRPAIQTATGDALIEMTGLDYGHDDHLWQQWWAQQQQLSDADFNANLVRQRGDSYELERARAASHDAAVVSLLSELYHQAPANQRGAILTRYLQSPVPDVRAMGADLVSEYRGTVQGPPAGALAEVRKLLGDVSPRVRTAAARALSADPDSTAALLNQLQRENDPTVRIALISSLEPLGDLNALQTMVNLLQTDPSLAVRIEAARGIAAGGEAISRDPSLRRQTVAVLVKTLSAANLPGMQNFRAAIVSAMASLGDASLRQTFSDLLRDPNEPLDVRVSALRGLGNLQDPNLADLLSDYLNNSERDLRLAAVQALASTPQPDDDLRLIERLDAQKEPDPEVRAAAWETLKTWMKSSSLTQQDLETIADELKNVDPSKQLVALQALRDRLDALIQSNPNVAQREQAEQGRADQEEVTGDLLRQLGRPADAAAQYQQALAYWKAHNGQYDTIDKLSDDVMQSLLDSRQWSDAANFASNAFKAYDQDPTLKPIEQTISADIRAKAQSLQSSTDPATYDDAMAFFAAIDKMNPPLQGVYADAMRSIQQDMQSRHGGAQPPQ